MCSVRNMRRYTVGMATYDDFDGVYFTTQAVKEYHSDHVAQIVIVDNNPSSKVGDRIKRYAATIKATYVPLESPKGTAAPRDAIFLHATSEWVVVLDSHVIVGREFFSELSKHAVSDDLYHGTLIYDWNDICATHMRDEWGGELWGRWGRAEGMYSGTQAYELVAGTPKCVVTGKIVTPISKGLSSPFEIPAHGMGMWCCRRDTWLKFNPAFREFGGEEWYIHEKYRQAGRKAICIPTVTWRHRFSDLTSHPIPYPLTRLAKVKNYCIGHNELGLDTSRLYREFVGKGLISERQWNDMGCGCSKKRDIGSPPAPPSPMPPEWTVDGEITELEDVLKADVQEYHTLSLADKPYALGRWANKADRFVLRASVDQVRPFLSKYPNYSVTRQSAGWLTLSRLAEDKPKTVGVLKQAKNVFLAIGRASKALVKTGLPLVTEATHEARMKECHTCPMRVDNKCSLCGCIVDTKTWVATEQCPHSPPKWLKAV